MTRGLSQQLLSSVVRPYLAPAMERAGFANDHFVWNRSCNDLTHVIELQRSKHSDHRCVIITINIGICVHPLYSMVVGHSPDRPVGEPECWPSFRIGDFVSGFDPKAIDIWWRIASQDDAAKAGKEIVSALCAHCLPVLNSLDTVHAIKLFCDSHVRPKAVYGKLCYAVLCRLDNDIVTCRQTMNGLSDPAYATWKEQVSAVAGRMCL